MFIFQKVRQIIWHSSIFLYFFMGVQTKLAFANCQIHNLPYYNQDHHQEGYFVNPWPENMERPNFLKSFHWILGRILANKQKFAQTPFSALQPQDLAIPFKNYAAYWLGHSTVFVKTSVVNFITDPIFSERASPVGFAGPERLLPLPIKIPELPSIDLVLISHNHYDHLDESSVKALKEYHNPLFVVPLKMGKILKSFNIQNYCELDWWQVLDAPNFRIFALPAKHFSMRNLWDRNEVLWASYLLETKDNSSSKIYFAGDTAYGPHFHQIGKRFGPIDLALLPIGAYLPRWFMQPVHMDPEESIKAYLDLKARHFLAIHWGTFDLADEDLLEPPATLLEIAKRKNISQKFLHILPVGGYIIH